MRIKKSAILSAALAVCAVMMSGNTARANPPLLLDDGPSAPALAGPIDISMLDETIGAQSDPVTAAGTLNYYSNGGGTGYPGEIFTTPSGQAWYSLQAVTVLCAGSGGGNVTSAQAWNLNLYTISLDSNGQPTNAAFLTTETSQNIFTFTEGDWITFTNLPVTLAGNTTYAYTIQNDSQGYELIGAEPTFPGNSFGITGVLTFPQAEAVGIPLSGGTMSTNNLDAPGWTAEFDVNLGTTVTMTITTPQSLTPGNVLPVTSPTVSTGTVVTLSTAVAGNNAAVTYTWYTDGGTGGSLSAIPSSNASTYSPNTSIPGAYTFQVSATNSLGQYAISGTFTLVVALPNQGALLSDEGNTVVFSDCYNEGSLTNGGSGDGLNYYDNNIWNNGAAPSMSFTTGPNADGYTLFSVQLKTGGAGATSGSTLVPQPNYLFIYQIPSYNTNVATLLQVYTNGAFAFNFGDWLSWNGLDTVLQPNAVYAYSFENGGNGWAGLDTSPITNTFQGGVICMISPFNRSVAYDPTNTAAAFALGLEAIGAPATCPPFLQPVLSTLTQPIVGTPGLSVTFTENAIGATSYTWQTDGGSGGTLTNIPSSNSSTLAVNTTGYKVGQYSYDVVAANGFGTSTSGVVTVTLIYTNTTAVLTDIGTAIPTPGANDIYQTNYPTPFPSASGGGKPDGFNYYIDANPVPGETFTTGSNPQGYTLNSLAFLLAGADGGLPTNGQAYRLYFYTVNNVTSNAVLYASYISSVTNFVILSGAENTGTWTTAVTNSTDWFQWTGFSIPLQPNTAYAYTFGRDSAQGYDGGWDNVANAAGTNYAGGLVCAIGANGGPIAYPQVGGVPDVSYNAVFDLGITPISTPTITIAKAGTQVTLTYTGVLRSATSIGGPYNLVIGATSPYTVTPSGTVFYRASSF